MQVLKRGAVALIALLGAEAAQAQMVVNSLRPEARPPAMVIKPLLTAATIRTPEIAGTVIRPKQRPEPTRVLQSTSNAGFQTWLRGFEARARAAGIRETTFEAAFRDVTFDESVIRRDRNQSEFTKTIWQYLDSAVSDARIANGRKALRRHLQTLEAIERRYGVEKEVIVAVWGLESAYGSYRGSNGVIQSLATLAFEGRRGEFFEEQLIAALKIIQNGDTSPRNMTGSWAGAMGHTQFIPTSYLAYAVDFTGDGKRDIWSDDPTDALASTAAYLKRSGWKTGRPWGVEVKLPRGFDYALANRETRKSPAAWARMGVVGADGRKVPNHGRASILLPAGAQGAAFMIFDNFEAIEAYNTADAYVIGVGHLSDRINGGPAIRASWPTDDRALSYAERKEMQTRLTRAGFSTQGIDGKIGPKTIDAVRRYQLAQGLIPDGYASLKLLDSLR